MPAIRTYDRFRGGATGPAAAAAVAVAAAAVLTGCASSDTSDSGGDSAPRAWDRRADRAPRTMPAPEATPESVLTAIRALNTADLAVPRGASFEVEGERDARGERIWEVVVASKRNDEYADEYEVTVSGDGSKLLSRHRDLTPDDDVAKLRFSKTTAQQAVRLAYAYRPSELDSLEIDTRSDGRIVWQVTQTTPGAGDDDAGREVILDATTGNVLTSGADG
ncbi:PepSY domain-containing protein [Streptomyces sp. 7N604]|uniref:PepSY domain-containing protein n=1 Tax=Streptomyces sp. 7N604 TaxID=3457415 RepID=UPI003FCFBE2C